MTVVFLHKKKNYECFLIQMYEYQQCGIFKSSQNNDGVM